jgi:hypothetical protein
MLNFILNCIYNTIFVQAVEVIPQIWLGDCNSAIDYQFLKENDISVIVNCTADRPIVKQLQEFEIIRIPVNDSLLERDFLLLQEYLPVVLDFIDKKYKEKKNILIHCHAGKQRSAIVVASFIYNGLFYNQLNPEMIFPKFILKSDKPLYKKVFDLIVYKRPQAFTYGFKINFINTFRRYFLLD